MRLILTRHPGQAGALETGLAARGITPVFMPLTHQVLPKDPSAVHAALQDLGEGTIDWLVLTSGNTVRALMQMGWDGSLATGTAVAAVGPGTAAVLEALTGITDAWIPPEHHAAALAEYLPQQRASRQVLLPQSARADGTLVKLLEARGWLVDRVTAYDTVTRPGVLCGAAAGETSAVPLHRPPTEAQMTSPAELTAGDTVLITSSSAAEVWVQCEEPEGVKTVAIGEPTAMTLRGLGRPPEATLGSPSAEALAEFFSEGP